MQSYRKMYIRECFDWKNLIYFRKYESKDDNIGDDVEGDGGS